MVLVKKIKNLLASNTSIHQKTDNTSVQGYVDSQTCSAELRASWTSCSFCPNSEDVFSLSLRDDLTSCRLREREREINQRMEEIINKEKENIEKRGRKAKFIVPAI